MYTSYQDYLTNLFNNKFTSKNFPVLLKQVTVKDLRNTYGILAGQASKMTKNELIAHFSDHFKNYLNVIFRRLHSEIVNFIFLIADNGGELALDDFPDSFAVLLKSLLIAFPVTKDEDYKLIMSDTVLSLLEEIDRDALRKSLERNDLIIAYTRKLADVYGLFDIKQLSEYLESYEGFSVTYEDHLSLFKTDSIFSDYYDAEDGIFMNYLIDEIEDFDKKLLGHSELDYYRIPRGEFLDNDYTPEESSLLDFLANNLDLDEESAENFTDTIIQMVKLEMDLSEIHKALEPFDLNKYEQKLLERHVNEIYETTRRYSLKGHSLKELNGKTKFIAFPKNK